MRFDPAEISPSRRYQLMISVIVPRPIAFVSTRSPGGQLNLAPFSYFMGVASDPPLIALSVSTRKGELKDTARNLIDSGEFVVNVATEAVAEALNQTSGDWPPDTDEFALTGLTPVPSERVAPPRVGECPVALECRVYQVIPLGREPYDTRLVIGEILLIHAQDDAVHEVAPGIWVARPEALSPIARLGRNQYTTLGSIFAMDRPRSSS